MSDPLDPADRVQITNRAAETFTAEGGLWSEHLARAANELIAERNGMSETKLEVVERYGGLPEADVARLSDVFIAPLLDALGLDVSNDHFKETPRRVAAMLLYFTQDVPLEAVLKDGFDAVESSHMVIQKHIPFKGLCAHHLLPFFGTAVVGYIPRGRVVGLSKLARLVSAAGLRSPSTQEEITNSIARTLQKSKLEPAGVIVASRAVHGCMAVRGVNAPGTETIAVTDLMPLAERELFFQLIGEDW